MWLYEKKLEHPVKIKCKDLQMAKFLMAQYGGPDSELSASLRYLSQRYTMPTGKTKGLLTDIGISVTILPLLSFLNQQI
jgi:spore coat protein JC